MDFRDSPEEATFRDKLRNWLGEYAGSFKTSGDDYWARQGEWHQALYRAGFFGTSWPREFGGQELPPVYDVIVDEELARAGAPPRPSLGYLVVGLGHHGSRELQRAAELGLANHVVEDPLSEAIACAKKMMEQPRQAVEATKRLLNIHLERAVLASLDYVNAAEEQSFQTEEFRNIVARLNAPKN